MFGRIIYLLLFCVSFMGFSQNDSLVQAYATQKNIKELQEEQRLLNFEKSFFKALSQRAIGNYDKAIMALDLCQSIKPDDVAVNFELSKNYYALEKSFEATSYIKKALIAEPENIFMLQHLKDILVTDRKYREALDVQQKIVAQNPIHQEDLIILYIRNNQIEEARNLLIELEEKGMLTENLVPFKQSLMPSSEQVANVETSGKPVNQQTLDELRASFKKEKTFTLLSEILIKEFKEEDYLSLEKDGEEGIELFPAQPLVYLMYAKALNKLKKYDKAVTILQNGIDYVIDDYIIEAEFYDQLSLSYKGLGQNIQASKYYKQAAQAREKESQ